MAPWTVADQASLSVAFSRQEYWRWLPFLSPGDLPDPGIEPTSPALAVGFVMQVYVPRFFVVSQQRFEVTDIKALGASQLSGLR